MVTSYSLSILIYRLPAPIGAKTEIIFPLLVSLAEAEDLRSCLENFLLSLLNKNVFYIYNTFLFERLKRKFYIYIYSFRIIEFSSGIRLGLSKGQYVVILAPLRFVKIPTSTYCDC